MAAGEAGALAGSRWHRPEFIEHQPTMSTAELMHMRRAQAQQKEPARMPPKKAVKRNPRIVITEREAVIGDLHTSPGTADQILAELHAAGLTDATRATVLRELRALEHQYVVCREEDVPPVDAVWSLCEAEDVDVQRAIRAWERLHEQHGRSLRDPTSRRNIGRAKLQAAIDTFHDALEEHDNAAANAAMTDAFAASLVAVIERAHQPEQDMVPRPSAVLNLELKARVLEALSAHYDEDVQRVLRDISTDLSVLAELACPDEEAHKN